MTLFLSDNITNKAHKFVGNKYIYYSTPTSCSGLFGHPRLKHVEGFE